MFYGWRITLVAGVAWLLMSSEGMASSENGVFKLSLTELSNTKVTSLSKISENAFRSAAAVYILTQEDIKRMGVTSIPEALRVVPGVEVARISSNKWAVTARGFNNQLANKLLVLMDGRAVYNAHFSGVYWDVQDTVLEDIDRIEVIRGPGAAVWGANAVNGVVNIITKHARNTQGSYLSVTAGNQEEGIVQARYGGAVDDDMYYRGYVKYSDRDNFDEVDGDNAFDDWMIGRGGFRVDWDKTPQEAFSIQGDVYSGKENENRVLLFPTLSAPFLIPTEDSNGGEVSGGNLMVKWENTLSNTSAIQIQSYIDSTRRDYDDLGQKQNTFDIDLQHQWKPHRRHEVISGVGFRLVYQSIDESSIFQHVNDHRFDKLYSAFIQDKMALIPDRLYLTLGSKFEHNSYTGLEYQPSARMAWMVSDKQTAWAAVSKAVRTPNYAEHNFRTIVGVVPPNTVASGTPAGFVKWRGNSALNSEDMIAYEIGYRVQPVEHAYFDITAYYHDFENLVTTERGDFFPEPEITSYLTFDNKSFGEVTGVEISANWEVTPTWRLMGSYGLVNMDLHVDDDSADVLEEPLEGDSPRNTASLRSYWNVTDHVSVNKVIYFVDNLVTADIPAYVRFDMNVAWKPWEDMEIGMVGQNLFDGEHREFSEPLFASSTEVPRSIFGYVAWHF